jgi:23S rRNA pseudouridine2605 synthase
VELEDGPARFDEIAVISRGGSHSWFRVVIREGRNREVRRLWDSQGFLVSRLKRIRYGHIELPRNLRRGECEALDAESIKQLRQTTGLGAPQPVLTLSPVLHQRRANRSVTEYRPERGAGTAWTGGQDEARELRAYDRIREEPIRGRKPPRRDGKEVNGNVVRPERGAGGPNRGSKGRRVAPGQELPSVRTWFAGESRDGSRPGAPRGNAAGGAAGNRRPAGGKPFGARTGGEGRAAGGNPYSGFGGESRGGNAGNRAPGARPAQGGRPQGQGGNRTAAGPVHGNARPQGMGGARPQGQGGNRAQGAGRPQGQGGNRPHGNARPQGHGGAAGGRPPGRGGNRSGNR